jgi:hypothetical protein
MTDLRPIEPINLNGLDIALPEAGEPICERVDPDTLFIDPSYQRDIRERGLQQIRQIVEAFDWRKFKPPICAYAEHDGKTVLKVIDGQHTAIAAASHPNVDLIPVMIVEAADTASQAAAFVGQNTSRLGMTALQIHRASIVAGDPDALLIEEICAAAGVTILLTTPKSYKAGETVAVTGIAALIDRLGAERSRQVLEVLAKAKRRPVTAVDIKAVELLLTDPEYCEAIAGDDLATTICNGEYEGEAKVFAATHKLPLWKALASVWFRNTRKKRGALKAVA